MTTATSATTDPTNALFLDMHVEAVQNVESVTMGKGLFLVR